MPRSTTLSVVSAIALTAALASAHASPLADDPDVEIARRHFEQGSQFYAVGHYNEAIAEFLASRRIVSRPELDYNIARCFDRLERPRDAIIEYRRYLEATAGHGALDDEVRARVQVLRGRLEVGVKLRLAAPVAVGVGALIAGGVGAGLLGSIVPEYARLDTQTCKNGCLPATYRGLEQRAIAGYAVLGVAGALAIADIVLWAVEARRVRHARLEMQF